MKIYCAAPISGLSGEVIFDYYTKWKNLLESYGYDVLHPMISKKKLLRTEVSFKKSDYDNPFANNHAIYERDQWMVTQADVVFLNVIGAERVSIGAMFELAWASYLHKHTVLAIDEDNNIHNHAFVHEAADIVLHSDESSAEYLRKLIKREF